MARRLYRIPEVAELVTITPAALHRQRAENRAPGNLGFKIGSTLVWDADELEEWIDSQRDAERARFAARSEAVA